MSLNYSQQINTTSFTPKLSTPKHMHPLQLMPNQSKSTSAQHIKSMYEYGQGNAYSDMVSEQENQGKKSCASKMLHSSPI